MPIRSFGRASHDNIPRKYGVATEVSPWYHPRYSSAVTCSAPSKHNRVRNTERSWGTLYLWSYTGSGRVSLLYPAACCATHQDQHRACNMHDENVCLVDGLSISLMSQETGGLCRQSEYGDRCPCQQATALCAVTSPSQILYQWPIRTNWP